MSHVTDPKRPFGRRLAIVMHIAAFLAGPVVAANGEETLIVSPVIPEPSGVIHQGELVWADLLTTDPQQAVNFYAEVFDWQPRYFADRNYIELSHDGRVICSVVRYEDDKAAKDDARWLVSISVEDVDAAIQRALISGGEVLKPATDLPDRGRYSVISDTQGSVVMLLRAIGGDPDDDAPNRLDEWAWAELWTDDPDSAVSFYKSIIGYDSLRIPDANGGGRPDIPDFPRGPSAAPLPDFGMPGGGMMDTMDIGGFDF